MADNRRIERFTLEQLQRCITSQLSKDHMEEIVLWVKGKLEKTPLKQKVERKVLLCK